jgi:hypothetical protein
VAWWQAHLGEGVGRLSANIAVAQPLRGEDQQLPPQRLVAVHVGHVLEVRLWLRRPWVVRDLKHPQVPSLQLPPRARALSLVRCGDGRSRRG